MTRKRLIIIIFLTDTCYIWIGFGIQGPMHLYLKRLKKKHLGPVRIVESVHPMVDPLLTPIKSNLARFMRKRVSKPREGTIRHGNREQELEPHLCGLSSFPPSRLWRIILHFPTAPLGREMVIPLEFSLLKHSRSRSQTTSLTKTLWDAVTTASTPGRKSAHFSYTSEINLKKVKENVG